MVNPVFSEEMCERMAASFPAYGYITLRVDGVDVHPRKLVSITRTYNSKGLKVDLRDCPTNWSIPKDAKGLLEIVVYEYEALPDEIMTFFGAEDASEMAGGVLDVKL